MKKRYSKKRGPVQSKKVTQDGITFQSGLEKYCYLALKKEKLFDKYEEEKFTLVESFVPGNKFWERQSNGKGEYTRRDSRKILAVSYTPDFTGPDFIIETKGRANESFPLRYKLFKRHLIEIGDKRNVYKPQNRKEVDETVRLIKENRFLRKVEVYTKSANEHI